MAKRTLRTFLLLCFVSFLSLPALAQDPERTGPRLITEALTVERLDGDPVYLFTRFQVADYEGYSVEGAKGRYEAGSETLLAWGDKSRRVSIVKSGEESFAIAASKSLEIRFASESLRAEGEVEYRSSGTAARSERLLVDEWHKLQEVVVPLVLALRDGESRALVEEFFSSLESNDRLLLLIGAVEIEREDAQLRAEWAAFTEGDERFVTAGGTGPIELQLHIER